MAGVNRHRSAGALRRYFGPDDFSPSSSFDDGRKSSLRTTVGTEEEEEKRRLGVVVVIARTESRLLRLCSLTTASSTSKRERDKRERERKRERDFCAAFPNLFSNQLMFKERTLLFVRWRVYARALQKHSSRASSSLESGSVSLCLSLVKASSIDQTTPAKKSRPPTRETSASRTEEREKSLACCDVSLFVLISHFSS